MPPLPPVPSTIQYTLRMTDGADNNILNTFYQSYSNVPGASDAVSLAGTVTAQWNTHIAPLVGTWIVLISAEVNDLSSVFGAQAFNVTGGAGTAADGAHLASGTAVCISAKTGHKYRGGHGRVYLPGPGQAVLATQNSWTTAYLTRVSTGWSAFTGGIITAAPAALGAMKNVVVHRYGRCASPPCTPAPPEDAPSVPLAAPYTDIITSYTVNPKVATQRRRNQQGG